MLSSKSLPQRLRIMLANLSRKSLLTFALGLVSGLAIVYLHSILSVYLEANSSTNGGIIVPLGKLNGWGSFPEPAWIVPGATLARRVVAETPFARFEVHKVKTESGDIVNDWLWSDERAHVNILVHLKQEDKFLLFHQRKYGLLENKLAVIGGLFNKGETGEECARRELLEETGLEPGELISLGEYRVQVNRGGGILHAYYAKNSVKSKDSKKSDDYEKQSRRLFTRTELIKATLKGEVGEAQWVAAVALGLLYEEHAEHHSDPLSMAGNGTPK